MQRGCDGMAKFIIELILQWLIPFICAGAAGAALAYGKHTRTETQSIRDGMQCLLRAEIIRSYEKYIRKGYCPIYAREALTVAYRSYHALGGNDVATKLYDEIMGLPTDAPEK